MPSFSSLSLARPTSMNMRTPMGIKMIKTQHKTPRIEKTTAATMLARTPMLGTVIYGRCNSLRACSRGGRRAHRRDKIRGLQHLGCGSRYLVPRTSVQLQGAAIPANSRCGPVLGSSGRTTVVGLFHRRPDFGARRPPTPPHRCLTAISNPGSVLLHRFSSVWVHCCWFFCWPLGVWLR